MLTSFYFFPWSIFSSKEADSRELQGSHFWKKYRRCQEPSSATRGTSVHLRICTKENKIEKHPQKKNKYKKKERKKSLNRTECKTIGTRVILWGTSTVYTAACPNNGLQRHGLQEDLSCDATRNTQLCLSTPGLDTKPNTIAPTRGWHNHRFGVASE